MENLLESEDTTDRQRADFFFKQIVLGVSEIHDEGFMHRDLKPANITINDDSLEVSIIDFETGNGSMLVTLIFEMRLG
jgi:serine/threonine protein kinase